MPADLEQVNGGKRGGWFRHGIAGALAFAVLLLAFGCGSANDYSSASLEQLALARSGSDPNRDPSGLANFPDDLAFSEDGRTQTTVVDTSSSVDLSQISSSSLFVDEDDLAAQPFIEPLTPDEDGAGRLYQRCVVDFGGIDWDAPSSEVAQRHAGASSGACTRQPWYESTVFQNGVLIFMVLSGEQNLTDALPSEVGADATVANLIAQGYDQIERMEIASTGGCENGEIQLAILEMREGVEIDPAGLEAIKGTADDVGALVDERDGITLIAGGGSPCISGVVVKPGLVAWFTSSDAAALVDAAKFLTDS